jgi:hypothetical protein
MMALAKQILERLAALALQENAGSDSQKSGTDD